MSTRSGKQIHSCNENIHIDVACERKRRNRRIKEHQCDDKLKLKVRENYVAYPTDDELGAPASPDTKPARSLRKNTILKDLNFESVIVQTKDKVLNENGEDKITPQEARKSRGAVENSEQEAKNKKCHDGSKVKKNKKIKKMSIEVCIEESKIADTNNDMLVPRKKKGSKNKKRNKERRTTKTIADKTSISSIDSFHSTISSPSNVSADTNVHLHNGTYDTGKLLDSTYDKQNESVTNRPASTDSKDAKINVTFDRVDITSDDSKISTDNAINSSPFLIESSMDCSEDAHNTPNKMITNSSYVVDVKTPPKLIREGTFTLDDANSSVTVPRPGGTPYSVKAIKSSNKKFNLTHSIEKPASSASSGIGTVERVTKVMFSSPVSDKTLTSQRNSKIIKSSMKGSSKSFFFENANSSLERPSARKRSYTNDAEDIRAKRKRLDADELQESVNRLSKPRTTSTAGKSEEAPTPSKRVSTPYLSKSESKHVRGKIPNFAALHQRRFAKMESLDECQERKAKRAKQLMSPMGTISMLERKNVNVSTIDSLKADVKNQKPDRKVPTFELMTESRPGYTRFGFRMKFDENPFSVPLKNEKKEANNKRVESRPGAVKPSTSLNREKTQQSLIGATSYRKDVAKQTVLREKSSTTLKHKRDIKRGENRIIIKGVRTNRRFELQMMSRNVNV